MRDRLRVLLISPCPATDPPGGDVTYTQNLLNSPPRYVEYTAYPEAMADGRLVEVGGSHHLKNALRQRDCVLSALGTLCLNAPISRLRRNGRLYAEPFRFFKVKSGEFDLVHAHIYPISFTKRDCPAVFSCGGPLRWMYEDARGWSPEKIARVERREKLFSRILGVQRAGGPMNQATRFLTYSKAAAQALAADGIPPESIDLAPPFVTHTPPRPASSNPRRLGFVARHFEDKGGPLVVAAFSRLYARRPDTELLIAGCEPPATLDLPPSVRVMDYVPQRRLLDEILPSLDMLVYPPRYDYPPSLTFSETLMRGIPIVTHDYREFPNLIGNGGRAVEFGNVEDLASAMEDLLDPEANRFAGMEAHKHAAATVSDHVVPKLVGKCYRRAIAEFGMRKCKLRTAKPSSLASAELMDKKP